MGEKSNIVVLSRARAGHNKTAGMGSRSRDLLFSRRCSECAHADVDIFYVILVISGQITSILARSFSHKLSPVIFGVMTTFYISVFDYAESPRQRRRRSVCLRKMRHVQVVGDRPDSSLAPDSRARKKSVSAK